jgi:hypothetical protein
MEAGLSTMSLESKEKDSFSPKIQPISKEKQSQSPKIQTEETTNRPNTVFTTHRKHIHRKQRNSLPTAKSNLFSIDSVERELGLTALFSGNMTHTSFACPFNLREAFKAETKLNGTSTCQELRRFMSAYIASSRMKKIAFGSRQIFDSKISIGEMNFTQNVQNRTRRDLSRNPETVVNDSELDNRCMIGNGSCHNPAVSVMVYQPKGEDAKEYPVCSDHASKLAEINAWRFKR